MQAYQMDFHNARQTEHYWPLCLYRLSQRPISQEYSRMFSITYRKYGRHCPMEYELLQKLTALRPGISYEMGVSAQCKMIDRHGFLLH
jgi:hypothetical protein